MDIKGTIQALLALLTGGAGCVTIGWAACMYFEHDRFEARQTSRSESDSELTTCKALIAEVTSAEQSCRSTLKKSETETEVLSEKIAIEMALKADALSALEDANKRIDEFKAVISRLESESESRKASDAQSPRFEPSSAPDAVDISNSTVFFEAFVDSDGEATSTKRFSVSGVCEAKVIPAKGTGFTVAWLLLADKTGSEIQKSLMGTAYPRYATISSGIYQFVIRAKRGAGHYRYEVSTKCRD